MTENGCYTILPEPHLHFIPSITRENWVILERIQIHRVLRQEENLEFHRLFYESKFQQSLFTMPGRARHICLAG